MIFPPDFNRDLKLKDIRLFFKSLLFLISISSGTIFFIVYLYLNTQCEEVYLRGQNTFICGKDREKLKKNNYNFE